MNDIKMSDSTKCPICESTEVKVVGIQPLFEDSRFDYCRCNHCGSEWRFYYKVAECNMELTKEGSIPENIDSDTPTSCETTSNLEGPNTEYTVTSDSETLTKEEE